jgi:hypothetical protein
MKQRKNEWRTELRVAMLKGGTELSSTDVMVETVAPSKPLT